MNQALTLLQRGVIQRLREYDRDDLADRAREAWSTGHRSALRGELENTELGADYERANQQAMTAKN
jgi:hypothetical protein